MKKLILLLSASSVLALCEAQTLYVPSGTSGIGTSTTTNVGIGTSTPSNVQGWDRVLDVSGGATGMSKILATALNQTYRVGAYAHSTWNGGGGFIGTETNHKLFFITNYTPRMTLDVNGFLGIGTTSPSSLLHVNGAGTFNGNTLSNNLLVGKNGASLDGSSDPFVLGSMGGGNQDLIVYGDSGPNILNLRLHDGALKMGSSTTPNAVINNDGSAYFIGNVGIGTTLTPDAKLAVAGQVHAQEVKVSITVPGPDYVFDNNYRLTSLEGLKNYIDLNKHLPEVPSAKEMETNGVQLGEMNMLLLKKIEELTLHLIDQNKRIDDQQKEIKELKTLINK